MGARKYHPSLDELVTHQFDLSDEAAATGEGGIALACEHAARAWSLMRAMDVASRDNAALFTRLHQTQTRLVDAVRSLDSDNIRARIHGALLRLGGMATIDEIAEEVSKRIHFAEAARIQMMHMLGKEQVLSWPDHHAAFQIAEELKTMRRQDLVRSVLPMAFWRGRLWSAIPGRNMIAKEQ